MRTNFLKFIKRWVMDALKYEKKNEKVLLCNGIAQVDKWNLRYLRRQVFRKKKQKQKKELAQALN